MRIGICSHWFNRGQAVVARHVRSALDGLGHETFVLARPTRETKTFRPGFVDRTGVWDQPEVSEASANDIPAEELVRWAQERELELVFFDQNYGFEAIGALRRTGVRTVGRFVWEQFAPEHVAPAKAALDVIYSLTECERHRYGELGIESPRVHWGIHPELLSVDPKPAEDGRLTLFYPAGFLSRRKPLRAILAAFRRVRDPEMRLVIKAQVERRTEQLDEARHADPRVEVLSEDLPTAEYLSLFASTDVCLAPSRWEGLGLHLFESMAFGIPVITNDNPPMNEVVRDGVNGMLVRGRRRGRTKSGVPAYSPSVRGLARSIRQIGDRELRERLAGGARQARDALNWERTVDDYQRLIDGLR